MTDNELKERWLYENQCESFAEFCYRLGRESVVLDKNLDDIVKFLNDEYKKALCDRHVYHPIAYALYNTWKKFDQELR